MLRKTGLRCESTWHDRHPTALELELPRMNEDGLKGFTLKRRSFLDANVLFSAALPGSRMSGFLGLVRKSAELASSQAAADEAMRNLQRTTPDAPRVVQNLRELLRNVSLTSLVAELPGVQLVDKDRHILGAAVASRCSHLLTRDERHFKHLFGQVVGGVRVVHAALLAEELWDESVETEVVPRSGLEPETN